MWLEGLGEPEGPGSAVGCGVGSGRGVRIGRSVASGSGEAFPSCDPSVSRWGEGVVRAIGSDPWLEGRLGTGLGLRAAFGLESGTWRTAWMVDAARSVHTAGLVLPVATVALVIMIAMAAPTRAGVSRQTLLDLAAIPEL